MIFERKRTVYRLSGPPPGPTSGPRDPIPPPAPGGYGPSFYPPAYYQPPPPPPPLQACPPPPPSPRRCLLRSWPRHFSGGPRPGTRRPYVNPPPHPLAVG